MAMRRLGWLRAPTMQALNLITFELSVNTTCLSELYRLLRVLPLALPHTVIAILGLFSLLLLLVWIIVALAITIRWHLGLLFDAPHFRVVATLATSSRKYTIRLLRLHVWGLLLRLAKV